MQKLLLLFLFMLFGKAFSQTTQLSKDIFNNWNYRSQNGQYTAKLEKNIFNDLLFSDNRNNKITFDNKFLSNLNPTILNQEDAKQRFFIEQIKIYERESNNQEKYSIDIFNTWIYDSSVGSYKAEFKKDIFDTWNFTDNKGNKISFDKNYIATDKKLVLNSAADRGYFFLDMIAKYRNEKNYVAEHKVDIFNNVNISDNRGYKFETQKSIFEKELLNEDSPAYPVFEDFRPNNWEGFDYQNGQKKASLQHTSFDRWVYTDSNGNKLEFGKKTWEKFLRRHQSIEKIFQQLLRQYL